MMKCKNCGREIVERTTLNGSGKKYLEHKEIYVMGILTSFTDCKKAEKRIKEV